MQVGEVFKKEKKYDNMLSYILILYDNMLSDNIILVLSADILSADSILSTITRYQITTCYQPITYYLIT
jgi:hypothetical protein